MSQSNDEVHELTNKLRALGVAVCVFTPEDVVAAHCGDKRRTKKRLEAAQDWLSDNRKYVEEAMCEGGWNPINFATDPIA